jgi:NAD(P)-dependent dehydrogenase (short-subunit alcohol dehydrogenase family)
VSRLAGKVALVTGAGRGIGEAIAQAFAREGAATVLAELDLAAAERVRERIEATTPGARVLAVRTDVTRSASLCDARDAAEHAFGPVDVLVNNAGINVFCDPLTMNDDDWRRCFAVDLDGVWNGCKAVLPSMVERGGGSIVNIASTHAFQIIPGCFPYPVAKHGVLGLTRARSESSTRRSRSASMRSRRATWRRSSRTIGGTRSPIPRRPARRRWPCSP